jgi:hypothetical protein
MGKCGLEHHVQGGGVDPEPDLSGNPAVILMDALRFLQRVLMF